LVILITLVTLPETDSFSAVFAELTALVAVLAVELAEVVVEAVDVALLVSLTVLFAELVAFFAELAALSLALLPQPTVIQAAMPNANNIFRFFFIFLLLDL